jgi:hypothetical protein
VRHRVGPCGNEAFRSQPKTLMDSGNAGVTGPPPPLVDPTPISFLAKWEDMLALERRIRSSHYGNNHPDMPAQPKQAQTQTQAQAQARTQNTQAHSLTQAHAPQKKKKAAEASRSKRCSREHSKSLTTRPGEGVLLIIFFPAPARGCPISLSFFFYLSVQKRAYRA